MGILLALAILAQSPAARHREAVDRGVAFPDAAEVQAWTKKSAAHKRVLGILLDRANWAESLAALDARTGLWSGGGLDIRVVFRELGQPARGAGREGRGEIAFDVEKLARYEKSVMDYERMRAGGAQVLIPPARTSLILHHELTHCFQDMGHPLWALEGMAAYVAEDPHFAVWLRHEKVKIEDVDAKYEHAQIYGRGWAFFEYVRAKHGDEAVRKLLGAAMKEGVDFPEAAAAACGRPWTDLKKDERAWSAKWIAAYKGK